MKSPRFELLALGVAATCLQTFAATFGDDAAFLKQHADVYRRRLPMLEKIPGFSGCTPWILCAFRSPRRLLSGIQDGWNIKGLISHDGKKKEAFSVLQKIYDGFAP